MMMLMLSFGLRLQTHHSDVETLRPRTACGRRRKTKKERYKEKKAIEGID